MMSGLLPLSILLIKAVTMYSVIVLFEYLNMPRWSIIWFVGLLSIVQDMTMDPVYIHGTYHRPGPGVYVIMDSGSFG